MKCEEDKQNQNKPDISATGNCRRESRATDGFTASNMAKRKSSTTLVCELTRLKSQQKYLECNQVKLIPEHFYDTNDSIISTATIAGTADCKSKDNTVVIQLINEIEHLKIQLDRELTVFRQQSRTDVKDMCLQIKQIKEDIQRPDRLHKYPMGALREHIIGINTQLERLNLKNATELQMLQKECENLEIDTKLLIK